MIKIEDTFKEIAAITRGRAKIVEPRASETRKNLVYVAFGRNVFHVHLLRPERLQARLAAHNPVSLMNFGTNAEKVKVYGPDVAGIAHHEFERGITPISISTLGRLLNQGPLTAAHSNRTRSVVELTALFAKAGLFEPLNAEQTNEAARANRSIDSIPKDKRWAVDPETFYAPETIHMVRYRPPGKNSL